jgi:hypothetical protein
MSMNPYGVVAYSHSVSAEDTAPAFVQSYLGTEFDGAKSYPPVFDNDHDSVKRQEASGLQWCSPGTSEINAESLCSGQSDVNFGNYEPLFPRLAGWLVEEASGSSQNTAQQTCTLLDYYGLPSSGFRYNVVTRSSPGQQADVYQHSLAQGDCYNNEYQYSQQDNEAVEAYQQTASTAGLYACASISRQNDAVPNIARFHGQKGHGFYPTAHYAPVGNYGMYCNNDQPEAHSTLKAKQASPVFGSVLEQQNNGLLAGSSVSSSWQQASSVGDDAEDSNRSRRSAHSDSRLESCRSAISVKNLHKLGSNIIQVHQHHSDGIYGCRSAITTRLPRRNNNTTDRSSCVTDFCQNGKCAASLGGEKAYCQRYRLCKLCIGMPSLTLDGEEKRFCQQCSLVHPLGEFDSGRKSCRKKLAMHALRLRERRAANRVKRQAAKTRAG